MLFCALSRSWMWRSARQLLWLAGCVATLAEGAAAQAPDQIFYNGKIVTVDDGFTIRSAVAIRGDTIMATGDTTAIRALADGKTVQTSARARHARA
jgi:hypothetical protein